MALEYADRLDAAIDRTEIVDLMRGMQAFRSFPPGEGPCMEYLAHWFNAQGVVAGLIDMHNEPGRPNLVARVPGAGGGRSMMFNGHIDIDPIQDDYPGDPWACYEENGRLYGHGLGNMKAGMAAMAAATVAVARARVPIKGDLTYTAVVGELQGGTGATELVRRNILADCCLVGEPSGDLKIGNIHAGAVQFLIHVGGKSTHISRIYEGESVNAIEKMTKVIGALQDVEFSVPRRSELPGLPQLNVGGIHGGWSSEYTRWRPSLVPDKCSIVAEVRGLPGQDWVKTMEEVEAVLKSLAAADPDLEYEIELPPATNGPLWNANSVIAQGLDVPKDHYLPEAIVANHKDVLGAEPEWNSIGAWNDSGHYTAAGCTSVVYGPSATREESGIYMDIDRVVAAARIQARVAADICTSEG